MMLKRQKIAVDPSLAASDLSDFVLPIRTVTDDRRTRIDGKGVSYTDGEKRTPSAVTSYEPYLAKNAVYSWFSSPEYYRHVASRDCTYFGYIDTLGNRVAAQYDHETKELVTTILDFALDKDDHSNPVVIPLDDDRLLFAYGEHNGPQMFVRVTTNPEDITSFDSAVVVFDSNNDPGSGYSYSNLVVFPDGTIRYHTRPNAVPSGGTRDRSFKESTDGGSTWSSLTRLFNNDGERPYPQIHWSGDRVDYFFNLGGPGEVTTDNDILHFYYDHSTDEYRQSDGTLIGTESDLPITPSEATTVAQQSNVQETPLWTEDAFTDGVNPICLFTARDTGDSTNADMLLSVYYARWDGSSWKWNRIPGKMLPSKIQNDLPDYHWGATIDRLDPSVVYAFFAEGDGYSRLHHCKTEDGGSTWTVTPLSENGTREGMRPRCPENRADDFKVGYLRGVYTNFINAGAWSQTYDMNLQTWPQIQKYSAIEEFVRVPTLSSSDETVIERYVGDVRQSSDPGKLHPNLELLSGGYQHSGDGSITTGTPNLNGATEFTVLIQFSVHQSLSRDQYIVSTRETAGDSTAWFTVRLDSNDNYVLELYDGSSTQTATFTDISPNTNNRNGVAFKLTSGGTLEALFEGTKSADTGSATGFAAADSHPLRRGDTAHKDAETLVGETYLVVVWSKEIGDDYLNAMMDVLDTPQDFVRVDGPTELPTPSEASYRDTIVAQRPLAYWRLGESSGTTAVDEIGNFDGTYEGSPTLGASGAISGDDDTAVDFDGSDDAVAISRNPLITDNSRSVAAWIKTTNAGTDQIFGMGDEFDNPDPRSENWEFNLEDNTLAFRTSNGNRIWSEPSGVDLNDGNWHHVVITMDGAIKDQRGVHAWADGVKLSVSSESTADPINTHSNAMAIGAGVPWSSASNNRQKWFTGTLDEVVLYDRVLSEDEIKTQFAKGAA